MVEKYFTGTASRVGGIGLDVIAREVQARHQQAFPNRQVNGHVLDAGGQYQWRADGEFHLFNPQTVHALQKACRNGDYKAFKDYSGQVNDQSKKACTLRGLLELKPAVPARSRWRKSSRWRRFSGASRSGAMSYGSISQEAHETLAIAMNRIHGKSNTGEGGEDPARYVRGGQRRFQEQRHQASGLRPGLASPASIWSRPRNCKSRWPRAPSRAKAASCPAEKSFPGLPKCASPRRASA